MSKIKLSKDAAIKVKRTSEETYIDLVANNNELKRKIFDEQYMNLTDGATTKKLMEMFSQLENLLRQLRNNFNDVEEFCDETIDFIDRWNND